MRQRSGAAVTAIGGAAAAYVFLARSQQLRWGATDDEADGPLLGDDLIPHPDLSATRAIAVRTSAGQVWPWIAQLGQGRGGFYSYDFLENLVGCDIHSADRIIPEWQDVRVGDEVKLAPQVGSKWPPSNRRERSISAAASPWGTPRLPTTSAGPSRSENSQTERRGCSCVSDTATPGGGRRSSSSPFRLSAS